MTAPVPPRSAEQTGSTDQPRLAWAEPAANGSFDGAWWPRSRNAPKELESIAGMVGDHLGGVITRASLNLNSWDRDQPRRLRVGTKLIRLGWFRTLDASTATFAHGLGARLTMLVVAPDVDPAVGQELMRQAAGGER